MEQTNNEIIFNFFDKNLSDNITKEGQKNLRKIVKQTEVELKLVKSELSKISLEKEYIGPYKVVKVFRVSGRKQVLKRFLSKEEAQTLVKQYPNSTRSMVVFTKQFTSEKYFV